jgi:hypothetical protein
LKIIKCKFEVILIIAFGIEMVNDGASPNSFQFGNMISINIGQIAKGDIFSRAAFFLNKSIIINGHNLLKIYCHNRIMVNNSA